MAKGNLKYSQQFKEDAGIVSLGSSEPPLRKVMGESWSQRICTEKLDESEERNIKEMFPAVVLKLCK